MGWLIWSLRTESNRRPLPYQGSALPTELRRHKRTTNAPSHGCPCLPRLHAKRRFAQKVPTLYHTRPSQVKRILRGANGAYERNRTGDLFLTKEVLYLLSYVGAKRRIQYHTAPTKASEIPAAARSPVNTGVPRLASSASCRLPKPRTVCHPLKEGVIVLPKGKLRHCPRKTNDEASSPRAHQRVAGAHEHRGPPAKPNQPALRPRSRRPKKPPPPTRGDLAAESRRGSG